MSQKTGHRAAIVAHITTQLTAQGSDAIAAAQKAQAIVDEKANRTKAGVSLVVIGIVGAGASAYLGAPIWATLAIGIGCALVGADRWSNEYVSAGIKDFWGAVSGIFSFFRPGGSA